MLRLMKNQKGFAPLVVLVIVIVVGVAVYFGFMNKSAKVAISPSPTVSSTKSPSVSPKDETLGWKIYTNAKYGFEFKYPTDWKVQDTSESHVSIAADSDKRNGSYGPSNPINVSATSNTSHLSLSQWVNKNVDKPTTVSSKEIQVGGYTAIQNIETGNITSVVTYSSSINNVVSFDSPESSPYLKVYNQILSTFKFTK